MEEGWHLYSVTQGPPPIATRIRLAKDQPFQLAGPVESPVPESGFDQNFGIDVEYYAGTAVFRLPVVVAKAAAGGGRMLVAEAYFQACDDRMCLPPQTVKSEAPVEILAGAAPGTAVRELPLSGSPGPTVPPAAAEGERTGATIPAPPSATLSTPVPASSPAGVVPPPDATSAGPASPAASAEGPAQPAAFGSGLASPIAVARPQSFMSFIWLAMSMGALALLTPCVFPMVPITVSYFTKRAAGGRGAAFRKASTYALGIILTFTALGLLLALLLGATSLNQFAANPWINLLITAIFIVFALNLFGAFELQAPTALVNRLDRLTRRQGGSEVVGTLLMGFTFTLTSFTCTVPFVGTLLVMAAQGEWQWPLVGMVAYSTVFAAPFFVLALAPQLVAQLPRSGGWMHAVKIVMGFLEVAAAMKFISNVDLVWGWGIFTREFVLATWVGVGGVATLYLVGLIRLSHEDTQEGGARVGAGRLVTALVCLTLTVWLVTGLFGRRLGELEAFLPPATEAASTGGPTGSLAGELSWISNDYDGALAEARRTGRRVVVDFTGYTCTNCRWMEANMFPRPEVRRELDRYVRVRLYTDGDGELFRRQQEFQQKAFGTIALPYYAILEADGRPLATFPGLTRDAGEFVRFLQSGAGRAN